MTRKEQIKEALQKLAGNVGPLQTLLVTVASVDEAEFTCIVEDEDVQITDVRLRPVLNTNEGVTIFPKIGTWVLIQRIEDDAEWIVVAVDQIEKYRIMQGGLLLEMKDGTIMVKKGDDSLKEVLKNIIEAVSQIVVMYGNNPNYDKLTTALVMLNNIMV